MDDLMLWSAERAFRTAQALMYALPLVCLLGVAVQAWPGRFGVLGSSASRRAFSFVMIAVWLFAIAGALLLNHVTENYSRSYGFLLLSFLVYLGPSMILSLIGGIVRYKMRRAERGNG
ncbi:hypothetical protein [Achromobacter xylosoxidans]|uniref:hypothetical protein n=1 Tax=Alcaligenes xylosoxydans xylosoxydans TaxID=85698 RepID=UPI000B495775|nr:hypothetical protein [Achromobacter xylosoxidans]